MKKYRYTCQPQSSALLPLKENSLFLDIETTGFQRDRTFLTILALAWQEGGTIIIEQWFNEWLDDPGQEERHILAQFQSFLEKQAKLPLLIHYNGTTFDLPYLMHKEESFGIKSSLADCPSLDLYRYARKYKSFLGASGLKQKNMEEALGLFRKDHLSGQELISAYFQGIHKKDPVLLDSYLLHNREDMEGMIFLQNLFRLDDFFNGSYEIADWHKEKEPSSSEHLSIELRGSFFLKKSLGCPREDIQLQSSCWRDIRWQMEENRMHIDIPSLQMEAKYFYPNYKDYFYLPLEDRAIHKSVASFVEKEFRQKAAKETCYMKKRGIFYPLPLPDNRKKRKEWLQRMQTLQPFFEQYGGSTAYIPETNLEKKDGIRLYLGMMMAAMFKTRSRVLARDSGQRQLT